MDPSDRLAVLRQGVEEALLRLTPSSTTRPARLHEAMRYSLLAGGKRLRPVLVVAIAQSAPAPADPWPAAVAVECLHTYSLIHDDLPAMDDSDLRRGRPTCHRAFDEATALLAGDALLTFAFERLVRSYASEPALAVALVTELAAAAGSTRLIGGQMEDLAAEGRCASADELEFIHRNKTGALLRACFVLGGLIARAEPTRLDALARAGEHAGLAFQIVDDLLDATGDSATLGKPAGADAAAGKNTYPRTHGLERARAEARRQTALAVEALDAAGPGLDLVRHLVASLEHRVA